MNMIRVDDTTMAEINITPFTDVLLVLLVIFMILAAMVVPPGFQKSLPDCRCLTKHPAAVVKRIDLVITRAGRMFLGTQPVDERTIYGALSAASSAPKHPHLSIIADGKSHYRFVVRALDAAKAARIDDVTLVTQ